MLKYDLGLKCGRVLGTAVSCFCSKAGYFTGNLGTNMIEHVSEMELYIILSTLERFEHWNRTVLIIKYQWGKQ